MILNRVSSVVSLVVMCGFMAACEGSAPPPVAVAPLPAATPPPAQTAAPAPAPASPSTAAAAPAAPSQVATPKPALDATRIATATGGKPETSENVVKVSFPRDDVPVAIEAWKMPPFMGLTSWAAFVPGEKPGIEAMVMGDLVLFEDEVNPAMSAALDNGVEVTALHNHFFRAP
jgi:hypothetical protein